MDPQSIRDAALAFIFGILLIGAAFGVAVALAFAGVARFLR